ncbi:hypothetical protein [Rhodoferax mekongensis]|uniref:hypothetical protein n=1 Tax=Rhodoferax mekongensis TaxID=3068341 RepID=UPI0028BE9242|nr:hypothetical protein [Rhodoferax sp. TBRC 17199]MDT7515382.1 hypothetical protein [Rhodoferax sp. TBRC 17199]
MTLENTNFHQINVDSDVGLPIDVATTWKELQIQLEDIRDTCTQLSIEMKDWVFEQGAYATQKTSKDSPTESDSRSLDD